MFFSKIFSSGPKKEELIFETSDYKLFITTLDGKKVSKFIYKNGIKQFNILKKIHHENLISPIKINLKTNTFYTQPLVPFSKIYRSNSKEFNEHIFLCLAKSIEFLNTKCKILHNNIDIYSLFFNEEGKIVLGGFEKSKTTDYFESDNIQFSNLIQKYLKISTNYSSFIKNNKSSDYFIDNEIFFFGFEDHTVESKKEFLNLFKFKEVNFVDIYKMRVIQVFLNDLSKDFELSYKYEILNMIFSLKLESYDDLLIPLFNILDTNVRIFLFKNSSSFMEDIQSLDKCLDSILLGFKIRKNDLRKETIKFCKLNYEKFNENSKIKILDILYEFVAEPEDMLLVLKYINDTNPIFKSSDIIYKICKKYLTISLVRNETLKTIQIFYSSFNKNKVSTELLPLICTYLADEKLQSSTFLLIESILNDLKLHKEKIITKDWSIISKDWSFTDFFQSKKNIKCKSVEDIKEECKLEIESNDEWEDDW